MIISNIKMNMNKIDYLPNDIMSLILNIRSEEMKKDKEKLKYDKVMKSLKNSMFYKKQDSLSYIMENKGLWRKAEKTNDYSEIDKFIDSYEWWELPELHNRILSDKESYDMEEGEIAYNYLNQYI